MVKKYTGYWAGLVTYLLSIYICLNSPISQWDASNVRDVNQFGTSKRTFYATNSPVLLQ